MTCAPSDDSDQPGHSPSLIRGFAVRMKNLGSLPTHWAHSEDSDQSGRMRRLIWVFAGRKGHFVGFVVLRLKCRFPLFLLRAFLSSGLESSLFAHEIESVFFCRIRFPIKLKCQGTILRSLIVSLNTTEFYFLHTRQDFRNFHQCWQIYLTYPYPTRGIDKKRITTRVINTLVV